MLVINSTPCFVRADRVIVHPCAPPGSHDWTGMLATAGQVLCSASAWSGAKASRAVNVTDRINSVSMGRHVLRGVAEPIEVFHCRLRVSTVDAPTGATATGAAVEAIADGTPPPTAGGGAPLPAGAAMTATALALANSHASTSAGASSAPYGPAGAPAASAALTAASGLPRLDTGHVDHYPGRMGPASLSRGRPGTPTAGGRRQHQHYHVAPSPHKRLSVAAAPNAGAAGAAAAAAAANEDLSRGGSASAPLAPFALTGMPLSPFVQSSVTEVNTAAGTPTLLVPEAGGLGHGGLAGAFRHSSAASGRQSPSAPLVTASLFDRVWEDAGAAGVIDSAFAATSAQRTPGTQVSVAFTGMAPAEVAGPASADAAEAEAVGPMKEPSPGGSGSGLGAAGPPAPWSVLDHNSHAPLSGHLPLPPLPEAEMLLEPYPSVLASGPNTLPSPQAAPTAAAPAPAAGSHSTGTGTDQCLATGGEHASSAAGISAAWAAEQRYFGSAPAGGVRTLSRAAASANARAGARLGEHLDSGTGSGGDRRSSAQFPGRSVEGRSSAALLTLPSLSQLLGRESAAGGVATSGVRSHLGHDGMDPASPAYSGSAPRRSLAGVDSAAATAGMAGAFASAGRLASVLSGRFSGPGLHKPEARGSTGHSGGLLRLGLGLGLGAGASGGDRVRGGGGLARLGGGGGGRRSSTGGDRSSPSGAHTSLAASATHGNSAGGSTSGQAPQHPRGPAGSGGDAPRRTRRRSVLHTRAANVDPGSINRALLNSTSIGRRDRIAGLKSGDSRR